MPPATVQRCSLQRWKAISEPCMPSYPHYSVGSTDRDVITLRLECQELATTLEEVKQRWEDIECRVPVEAAFEVERSQGPGPGRPRIIIQIEILDFHGQKYHLY